MICERDSEIKKNREAKLSPAFVPCFETSSLIAMVHNEGNRGNGCEIGELKSLDRGHEQNRLRNRLTSRENIGLMITD